jgi:protein phosphatase inhibitor 2
MLKIRRTKHIVWDEQNLQHNDANKTAKMKITEPKTPYNRGFDPDKELLSDDGK